MSLPMSISSPVCLPWQPDAGRLVACALALVDDATATRTPAAQVDRFLYGLSLQHGIPADPFGLDRIRVVCPDDWSSAFVHFAGFWSHYDVERESSAWPLPPARTAAELAAFAGQHGVLAGDAPHLGDVYVLWSPAEQRFTRSGIVCSGARAWVSRTGAPYFDCLTIDADTTRDGALHGPSTVLLHRRLAPEEGDRLIRWTELPPRAAQRQEAA